MRNIKIYSNDAGQRLDKFLLKRMPTMPKGMLYKLIRKKDIRLNGARCKGMELLHEGDVLTVYAKDMFFDADKDLYFLKASGKPEIVYEDKNLLIAYKPSGMLSHGGKDGSISLLDEIRRYLFDKGVYDPDAEQSFAPALCNRIDRNTEGLVIAAVNAQALREMNAAIRDRKVHKHYLAVTAKPLPKQSDICTAYLKKTADGHVTVRADAKDNTWKRICTRYTVLAQNSSRQLVHIELLTGRTHQIRAHLAYLGAPLLGDMKYGSSQQKGNGQCLCSYALSFSDMGGILSGLNDVIVTAPDPTFIKNDFPDVSLAAFRASPALKVP